MLSLVNPPAAALAVRRRSTTPRCSTLREADTVPGAAEMLRGLREAKRVVLVRHGQSTWNEEGRIQGSSDFSILTSKGESQAETSRQMLLSDSFDVCFTRSFLLPSHFPLSIRFCGFELFRLSLQETESN